MRKFKNLLITLFCIRLRASLVLMGNIPWTLSKSAQEQEKMTDILKAKGTIPLL